MNINKGAQNKSLPSSKKLSEERLAIEAYALSKYPESRKLIDELGEKYLEAPEMIEKGREHAKSASDARLVLSADLSAVEIEKMLEAVGVK